MSALPGEKRVKLRALLELSLDALDGTTTADPLTRLSACERMLAILALERDLDINVQTELMLEQFALILRGAD
jgi:hypothetical protein